MTYTHLNTNFRNLVKKKKNTVISYQLLYLKPFSIFHWKVSALLMLNEIQIAFVGVAIIIHSFIWGHFRIKKSCHYFAVYKRKTLD